LNPDLASKLRFLIKQGNVVYIPNGVDTELFNRKFVVGFIGAILGKYDHKGFLLAKQACDELGLEIKLKIIRNASHVDLHESMPDFYKKIDCLVLPSVSEGCNNPTLEALAMNKPVISTNVGIVSELENIIIVERDKESIKKALIKLSGRIQILEKYTWAIIAKEYRKLYEKHIIFR
jgi:glycosyltransferase involved in cell wall biosynthesis